MVEHREKTGERRFELSRLFTGFAIGLVVFFLFAILIFRRDRMVEAALPRNENTQVWPFFEHMDQAAFDRLFHVAQPYWSAGVSAKSTSVVAVVIDPASMYAFSDEFGRWPWPRSAWEPIISFIAADRPKAVLFDILFPEPNKNDPEGCQLWPPGSDQMLGIGDISLCYAVEAAGNVFLPYLLTPRMDTGRTGGTGGSVRGKGKEKYRVDDFLEILKPVVELDPAACGSTSVPKRKGRIQDAPFIELAKRCGGFGWVDAELDPDGSLRRTSLFVRSDYRPGGLFPSLAAAAVYRYGDGILTIGASGVPVCRGRPLPANRYGDYTIRWRGSFVDRYVSCSIGRVILSQRRSEGVTDDRLPDDMVIRPGFFRDKYVVIGTSIIGAHDLKTTPFSPTEPGMIKHLATIDNLVEGRFMERACTGVVLAVTFLLCVIAGVSTLLAGTAFRCAILFLITMGTYLLIVAELFIDKCYQLDVAAPGTALLATFLAAQSWNYFIEDRQRRIVRNMFQKYMSPELVTMLENNPELIKPGGDRRILTAFFSDLANFTTLSESLDPEELILIINEYLELMTEEIIRQGGFLDKFQGDGIMAVFGVYPGQTDHALAACRAALGNQRDIEGLRRKWLEEGKAPVHVRIGINSGPMIAGNVGYEGKLNYTVLGDAVNLASRLEGANKQFGTLVMIGENTYELVKEHVFVRELDRLAVKGKRQGVLVYELLGIKGEHVLSDRRYELLEIFAEGRRLYGERRFTEAESRFRMALELEPDDGPCKTYIERCRLFTKYPPGDDWDGVFRLDTK